MAYKDAQAKELRRTGVYPPGGVMTRMEQCGCGHWCPPARYVRERRVDDVKDEKGKPTGQVKVTYTAWLPVCLDCFYAAMPLFDAVRVPSSPGSTTRIKDKELPAHLEGSGFGRRSKRRRFVADGGVCEEVVLEGGETYDLVVVPPPREAPDAPGGGDESAGKGNECMPS